MAYESNFRDFTWKRVMIAAFIKERVETTRNLWRIRKAEFDFL
jgi:hypothetical protein